MDGDGPLDGLLRERPGDKKHSTGGKQTYSARHDAIIRGERLRAGFDASPAAS